MVAPTQDLVAQRCATRNPLRHDGPPYYSYPQPPNDPEVLFRLPGRALLAVHV